MSGRCEGLLVAAPPVVARLHARLAWPRPETAVLNKDLSQSSPALQLKETGESRQSGQPGRRISTPTIREFCIKRMAERSEPTRHAAYAEIASPKLAYHYAFYRFPATARQVGFQQEQRS